MNPGEEQLCDAPTMAELIAAMAERIASERQGDEPLRLVGVRSRGFPIAGRLSQALQRLVGYHVPVGAVDITLYRDDLEGGERWPVLHGTEIPFDVDGAEIVLVDDVLFTGRTVRAALNSICDLGRPARVRLAVLIDRGHRELPVQPDVVGRIIDTQRGEHVRVRVAPIDDIDEVIRISPLTL